MGTCWSRAPADAAPSPRHHGARFIAFWATTTGLWRIVFFVITYACLFWASHAAADQKWVGMASALPLPGFFALAALIDDAETRASVRPIRDTLFLGPVLVIPFNWIFSHALVAMPQDAVALRYLLLFAMWTMAALAVLLLVPRIAARFDRRGLIRPFTRYWRMSENSNPHTNRLAGETSPYLLQHQHNPVDWWPWGPDALAEAKRANKPILLSVGYAACHWCHVMAHESFEDEATARVMNELFVNIKVDREERPDIDQIYMNALHLLGEQGGWPLTMFLTPDGRAGVGRHLFSRRKRATAARRSPTCCARSRGCFARSPTASARTATP